MPPPLLVFDLDGTLVDSAPDLLATLNAVLPLHGFAASADPALRDGIGHGARYLIEFALRQQNRAADGATVDALHRDFLAYYSAHIADLTRPYAGVVELLDRFAAAGWIFAVCTNKLQGLSEELLTTIGLAARFAAICGGDAFPMRKPDPEHLWNTIAAAGGAPGSALMIGDSRTDLDTARNAGTPFVGVTFGYTPIPMGTLSPDLLIERFDDLTPDLAAALISAPAAGDAARQMTPLS